MSPPRRSQPASPPKRGEIRWADLGTTRGHEQAGRRPVLIVSHDVFNERSSTVIALAMTSRSPRAGYPLTWRVPGNLLGRDSWVKISQVRTLSADRLGLRAGRLGDEELNEIVEGLLELIG